MLNPNRYHTSPDIVSRSGKYQQFGDFRTLLSSSSHRYVTTVYNKKECFLISQTKKFHILKEKLPKSGLTRKEKLKIIGTYCV